MLAITKLSADTQGFLNYVASGSRNRSLLTSIAIARALANTLSLPSAPVEDLRNFYRTTLLINIQEKISDLNELALIDCDAILDYTSRFYSFRYNAAYPAATIFCAKPETAVSDFLGASMVLDETTLELIKSAPVDLTRLTNGFILFFTEINQ